MQSVFPIARNQNKTANTSLSNGSVSNNTSKNDVNSNIASTSSSLNASNATNQPLPSNSQNSTNSNTASSSQTAVSTSTNSSAPLQSNPLPNNIPSYQSANSWNDSGYNSWNDPYWGGGTGGFGYGTNQNSTEKKLTPEEREEMIKKVYQYVLGREATVRDINYYKYSTLEEKDIAKQLLDSQEHKDILNNAREYIDLKSNFDKTEDKNRKMEIQIKDQIEEFKKLLQLLNEKNKYIEQLRRQLNNPYNIVK